MPWLTAHFSPTLSLPGFPSPSIQLAIAWLVATQSALRCQVLCWTTWLIISARTHQIHPEPAWLVGGRLFCPDQTASPPFLDYLPLQLFLGQTLLTLTPMYPTHGYQCLWWKKATHLLMLMQSSDHTTTDHLQAKQF
eukprot:c8541_g1_i1.p2 GENE.c8541_g1_i1~~c8541_g1_i1.p2  ORF type:complete len:137 (+),score=16.19 c8541_g1_i1:194-604(+)